MDGSDRQVLLGKQVGEACGSHAHARKHTRYLRGQIIEKVTFSAFCYVCLHYWHASSAQQVQKRTTCKTSTEISLGLQEHSYRLFFQVGNFSQHAA